MSRNEGVSPLRINKTPTASPTKSNGRALAEISLTERRRNSPSFNQATKMMYFNKESSPFRDTTTYNNSPLAFWKEQTISPKNRFDTSEIENEGSSLILSPKRNSIENLKKQSRVKNSSMFAREQQNEYDPSSILSLDRPLAAGRPLSTVTQNTFPSSPRKENEPYKTNHRNESISRIPLLSPSKASPTKLALNSPFTSPSKSKSLQSEGRLSPTKSSLVSNGRFNSPQFHNDSSLMSGDDDLEHETYRPLRRHAKSVTFDTAPPQVTEFEMVTPDPSATSGSREGSYESDEDEEDMSFDQDDSFDASLEDTDKTPVVLPEDWRHMSPEAANTSLTDVCDDVFDGPGNSPMPNVRQNGLTGGSRLDSVDSEADSRPLPPLPGLQDSRSCRPNSSIGVAYAAERVGESRRTLPPPPQAAGISKVDLLNMQEASMSLEDRLRLMNFDDERDVSTPTQKRHGHEHVREDIQVKVEEVKITETEIVAPEPKAPRISRESILRRVKSRNFHDYEEDYDYDRSYGDLADLDPDVPIPSRECSSNFDEIPRGVETENVHEACSFADMTEVDGTEISVLEDYERDASVIRHPVKYDEEDDIEGDSQCSLESEKQPTSQSTINTAGPPTPKAFESSPVSGGKKFKQDEMFASSDGPELDSNLDPLQASFATAQSPLDTTPKLDAMREFLRRPITPGDTTDGESEEPGTPESVIRHPVVITPPEQESSPEVPQREATIRGAGGKLKTRPSLIPDEVDMAAARRQVSGSHAPPVPERSPKRQSLILDTSHVDEADTTTMSFFDKGEKSILDLDLGEESHNLSFGLDREFNQIIDASKKGYLMRENSKMVVASSRHTSDDRPSSAPEAGAEGVAQVDIRKTSAERKPAWTKEPWNGKPRRKSIRTTSGRRVPVNDGSIPPLPGQESNVTGTLDSVNEQDDEDFEDGEERGRVFVKVVGVKDLDLPLPKHEQTHFQLTLDNGLHCVTTSWLELDQSAAIGQEFELVVLDDLEFQLTLQTKLEPPPMPTVTAAPFKPVSHKKSHSTFRNLLSSPKKRKEAERKAQEEADRAALQQQHEAQAAAKRSEQATAYDLLHDLVGPDGSFARAYVCMNNYESQAFGRPLTVDVPCFNEWAVDNTASSVKSKRGGIVRRPPYRIGKLTLQLLYVPKPKGAKEEDMPKSMNGCVRDLKAAEQVKDVFWEGHLSQQGGDCPYWRRRWFRLEGTKLTAFHETTRQPRATINLAKASKLLDDKSALQQPSSTKSGGRRKSGFAEDEEGYMFVEEGFRIRFANGEVIDFYADSREHKENWMKVLADMIGRDSPANKGWAAMVLEQERKGKAMRSKAGVPSQQAKPTRDDTSAPRPQRPESLDMFASHSKSVPSSPVKGHSRYRSHAPVPPLKDVRIAQAPAPRSRDMEKAERRKQVRSMIF